MSASRIKRLRTACRKANLDGLILTDLDQIRYVSGFSGTAGALVIGPKTAEFFTDSRYTIQAAQQVKGAKTHEAKGEAIAALKEYEHLNVKNRRYGISAEHLTLAARDRLQKSVPDSLLIPADDILAELGWVKEKSEINLIKKAVKISDTAFERILPMIEPGIRERELAAELEYQMIMLGSEKPAFETIVASGYRSAMPHGIASDKKVEKGDFVTFDFGATVGGYVSDITRTVVVGKATSRQKRVYDTVLRAQLAGIKKVKPGTTGVAVDKACRDIIKKAGWAKKFGHGTGHGVGYLVHTGPRVSPKSPDKLKAGNVITIEPGVYFEGWGGVRIEDDVVVTRRGGQVLNKAEKKLLEL
ncbi:M24 family metallopeptidase [candidate division GN15 bacterium]|nr:M24 family metallopeptidase [candidate division GN15 bacterium]